MAYLKRIKVCPLCRKRPEKNLRGVESYYYCPRCQFGWRKFFPKVVYQKDYYIGKSGLVSRLFQPLTWFFYFLRSRLVEIPVKGLWIDVGAGDGQFLKTVKARRKVGVEISPAAWRIMENFGLETMTNSKFLKSRGLNADIISFWHVLEHVGKPWEYLQAAKRNLTHKGKIIIGLPNVDSLSFRFFGQLWFHFQSKYHLWHFSPGSLKKVLNKSGFHIEKIDWWSPEHSLAGVLQTFINVGAGSENVLHLLVKRGTKQVVLKSKDVFWIVFWLTFGLPLALLFWVAGAVTHHPDSVVVVGGYCGKISVMRKPLVSVIIPTLNEARFLPQCLESIKRQTYKNIEIIVVDNHSTDKTVKIAKKFGARVYTAGPERAGQVNFGVKKAKGKYCYRVDGDFLLEPEIVEQCVKKCEEENLDGVAVHNTSAEGLGFWADVRALERDCYRDDDLCVAVRFFSKKAFEKIGGFDTSLFGPEDYDFHNRFLAAGFKFGRVAAIERHLGEPKSLKDIFKKSFIYGQEMARYFKKTPKKAIQQLHPLRSAFFRHFKELTSHPLLFLGFIIMGIVKSIGGWLGIIKAFVTGFKRKYQVVKKSYA